MPYVPLQGKYGIIIFLPNIFTLSWKIPFSFHICYIIRITKSGIKDSSSLVQLKLMATVFTSSES